jgi:hypothetical protein
MKDQDQILLENIYTKTVTENNMFLKIDTLINEQTTSGIDEDIIAEKVADIFLEVGSPLMSDPTMISRGGLEGGFSPDFVPDALNTAGVFPEDGLIGLITGPILALLGFISKVGLTTIVIKAFAKLLDKLLAKRNQEADQADAQANVEGEQEFQKELDKAIQQGNALTEDEKYDLAEKISEKLNKKYPKRNKEWWLKSMNTLTETLKGKGGIALALIANIVLI